MQVRGKCPCGNALSIEGTLAGERVKCEACGRLLRIPRIAQCSCGKIYRVTGDPSSTAKNLGCPRCQNRRQRDASHDQAEQSRCRRADQNGKRRPKSSAPPDSPGSEIDQSNDLRSKTWISKWLWQPIERAGSLMGMLLDGVDVAIDKLRKPMAHIAGWPSCKRMSITVIGKSAEYRGVSVCDGHSFGREMRWFHVLVTDKGEVPVKEDRYNKVRRGATYDVLACEPGLFGSREGTSDDPDIAILNVYWWYDDG